LPSNQAIAVNPGFFYNRFEYNGKFYICAKDLLEKIQKEFG
jgi:isoleucyl-tRNA synthetase